MSRRCSSGAPCPSRGCANRLRGGRCLLDHEREHTHDEIAAELGVSETQARRYEASVLGKLQPLREAGAGLPDELAIEIIRRTIAAGLRVQPDRDYFSSGETGFLRVPRRFSGDPLQHASRAPRAVSWCPTPISCGSGCARGTASSTRKDCHPMPLTDCTSAAERVAEIERLPLGDPSAPALMTEAAQAIAAERIAAELRCFPPDLTPVSADAIAAYTMLTERIGSTAVRYGERLADLHRRAVTSHPELAALCRSPEAIDDVAAAAGSLAVPEHHRETHATAAARAGAAATARYRLDIASHLAAAPGDALGDAARVLLDCPTLAGRLDAARARHEEHVRLDRERLAAEQQAAAQAAERQAEADRQAAARRAAEQAIVDPGATRADELVARLKASGLRDLQLGPHALPVADLLAAARGLSPEALAAVETALAAQQGAR